MRFVNLYNRLLKTHHNLNLIVAIAGDDIDRQNIVEIIENKTPRNVVSSHVRVKTCKLPFDKAHCLQVAIDELKEDDLFFVYDVDIIVTEEFIQRIYFLGHDYVYFPTLFRFFWCKIDTISLF